MITLSHFFFFCLIESSGDDVSPDTKLNDIMHLAELCIDLLHQNEEHHAEVEGKLIQSTVTLQGNREHMKCHIIRQK